MATLGSNAVELDHAFEAEQERWLRKRFVWYCAVVIGVILLSRVLFSGGGLLFAWFLEQSPPPARATTAADGAAAGSASTAGPAVLKWGMSLLRAALYSLALVYVTTRKTGKDILLRLAFWLVVASGALVLMQNVLELMAEERPTSFSEILNAGNAYLVGIKGSLAVFIVHFFACLFLPWKPMQAIRAVVPLIVLNAAITLVFARGNIVMATLIVMTYPFTGVPGFAVCAWRYSRFRERYALQKLHGSYREMRRELVDARRLHEALFPLPLASGPLRFGYLYEPMRQIGGDYVFARAHPQPKNEGDNFEFFNMLLVDVTGHGIAAALTVNRLHGEIERLFAENPEIGPGEVLSALNRYVHLTLANHSIYVTALCLRVDLVGGVIEYASGGHPPAFIARGAMSGKANEIEQLESTSMVLGACPAAEFDPGVRRVAFEPGDTLIAYTDGAIETRNAENRMLGLKGLRECLETATLSGAHLHGFAPSVLQAVEKHRSGPIADDTLIVEIRRPLEIPVQTRPAAEFVGAS